MTGKTKAVVGALTSVVVAAVALAVYFHPIDINYRLWRYRRDPDGFNTFIPQLCDTGPRAKAPIYEAFAKYGKDEGVAAFRVAVAASLRCLRYREGRVVIEEHVYQDLPAEPQLFDTIVRAYNQEPDATLRGDMLTYMWELDYRAHFAIFVGILEGPYPIEYPWGHIPSVDPYGHAGKRGPERDKEIEARRAEWCKVVSPVIQRLHADGKLSREMHRDAIVEIGRTGCSSADLRWLAEIARGVSENTTIAIEMLGSAARRSVPYARDTLVSLFAAPQSCSQQVDIYQTLTRISDGVGLETATAILDRAELCLTTKGGDAGPQPPCRDELVKALAH